MSDPWDAFDIDDPMADYEEDARVSRVPRMDKKELTAESRKAIINNINEFLDTLKMPRQRLARMAGISATTLTEILGGVYRGDTDKLLHKLRAAMDQHNRRLHSPACDGFVETGVATQIYAVLRGTTRSGGIGVFTGPSGIGKTMTLRAAIGLDFPNAIYVEVNPGCSSPLFLCREILRQMRNSRTGSRTVSDPDSFYSKASAFLVIREHLKDSDRLLVFDEADGLHLDSLNMLRQIHDATGCPIVLSGRPNLRKKIDKTTKLDEIGGSFRGRIVVDVELAAKYSAPDGGGGRWRFSVDEIAEVLKKWKVHFSPDVARWLCALANLSAAEERGGLRYAVHVYRMAVMLLKGEKKTIELRDIRRANSLLRKSERAAIAADRVDAVLERKTA